METSSIDDKMGPSDSPEAKLCRDQEGNVHSYLFENLYFCLGGYDCIKQRKYTGNKEYISAPLCGVMEGKRG